MEYGGRGGGGAPGSAQGRYRARTGANYIVKLYSEPTKIIERRRQVRMHGCITHTPHTAHARIVACTHAQSSHACSTCTPAHPHTCTPTHPNTRTPEHLHARARVARARIHTHTCAHVHTCTRAHTHACAHTHRCTHAYNVGVEYTHVRMCVCARTLPRPHPPLGWPPLGPSRVLPPAASSPPASPLNERSVSDSQSTRGRGRERGEGVGRLRVRGARHKGGDGLPEYQLQCN